MSDDGNSTSKTLVRVPTGLPGFDTILRGGLFSGGVYIFLAKPGCGKTILGNQICFRHVASGGRAAFVTLLTESHSRLISQLKNLKFFEAKHVGNSLSYITGYQALQQGRLKGLLVLLRQIIRDHKATFLVIDGMVTAGSMAESEIETKEFIHELQVFAELMGCTTLLLTGEDENEQYALRTMVDGLIMLHLDNVGMEAARSIEVRKFRGGAALLGRHLFDISDAGVTIYPRLESLGGTMERPDPAHAPAAAFGIAGLDEMVEGGLRAGSVTMAVGTPGGGKTLLGLSMLAEGARKKERGLCFGFFETPADLSRKAEAIGIPFATHVESGLIEILWHSPIDGIADALADRLLAEVRERRIRRVFLDGLGGFRDALLNEDRSRRFFGALFNELRAMGAVTLVSDETRGLSEVELPDQGLTAMLDNVILLRHVELHTEVHKLISVIKMRNGTADSSVREFVINAKGFTVSSASKSAEETLERAARGGGSRKRPPPSKTGRKRRRRSR